MFAVCEQGKISNQEWRLLVFFPESKQNCKAKYKKQIKPNNIQFTRFGAKHAKVPNNRRRRKKKPTGGKSRPHIS